MWDTHQFLALVRPILYFDLCEPSCRASFGNISHCCTASAHISKRRGDHSTAYLSARCWKLRRAVNATGDAIRAASRSRAQRPPRRILAGDGMNTTPPLENIMRRQVCALRPGDRHGFPVERDSDRRAVVAGRKHGFHRRVDARSRKGPGDCSGPVCTIKQEWRLRDRKRRKVGAGLPCWRRLLTMVSNARRSRCPQFRDWRIGSRPFLCRQS